VDTSAYVIVPHFVRANRARGLLASGKVEQALQEVRQCQATLPVNVDLAIFLVPELDKLGKKSEADELFATSLAVIEQKCGEYPRSASTHNAAAWLAACCRRQLDKGLDHARKAVELEPQHPSFLDTLAEIHFQLGNQTKALELVKKCIELAPQRAFYRKQLIRFEAGDPKAELPREEDE
jgi:tetratricopeptide (TPR) repeat protein